MSHLRKVGIRAYRSIVEANLVLGEITVVFGPTDSGKSNVVRALRDWSFNAAGGGFITHGKQTMRIAVAVGDSKKVMFEKTVRGKKGAGAYVVVDADTGEKHRFEKIGLTVPPEVVEITNMADMKIDDVSVPIQFALQDAAGWFLLSPGAWPPSKVSKVIGRVSGVDALLLAHRDLIQERNSLKKQVKKETKVVFDCDHALEGFGWLDKATKLTTRARKLHEALEAKRGRLRQASAAVLRLRDLRATQAGLVSRIDSLSTVVERADALGFLDRSAALQRAIAVQATLERLEDRSQGASQAQSQARGALQTAQADLRALAGSQALLCPLCGQGAHPECRAALEAEAGA